MSRVVSAAELARHSKPGDLWLAIDGDVYDVRRPPDPGPPIPVAA